MSEAGSGPQRRLRVREVVVGLVDAGIGSSRRCAAASGGGVAFSVATITVKLADGASPDAMWMRGRVFWRLAYSVAPRDLLAVFRRPVAVPATSANRLR